MTVTGIAGFCLTSADPERLARFYKAIGFAVSKEFPVPDDEIALLGLSGGGRRVSMSLGAQRVDIDAFDRPGRPYPTDTSAAAPIFQHLAIVTSDAGSAWDRAKANGASAISRDGPVTLPQSSGGVTAVKLRDPDGHPLEFLQFPKGSNPAWQGEGMLGIDHSAISVPDDETAKAFFVDMGLKVGKVTLNHGPEQDALDGIDDATPQVIPMLPRDKPPHLELLAYRQPHPSGMLGLSANDVAATRIVWHADRSAMIRDPAGHLHVLQRR